MFEIYFKTNTDCGSVQNTGFSNTKLKEISDISIMYSGLVSDEPDSDKENRAIALGYKTTECADIYYDKKTKSYYRWNYATKAFDVLDNAKKIYEDGAYLTKDKKLMLPSGAYEDKELKKFFNSEGKEIEERTFWAQRYKYESTSHPFIYYDKASNKYKRWEGSNFSPTDIVKVNNAGGYETSDGQKYASDGSYSYIENGQKKYIIGPTGRQATDNYTIMRYEAQIQGYCPAPGGQYYYDSVNNTYLTWDKASRNFVNTDVQEVIKDGYYKKQDKHYNSSGEEINLAEYTAQKNGMYKTLYAGIYTDKTGKNLFVWNAESNKFEKFDHEAKMAAFYSQKADGQIGDFEQGKNAGDCWLLSTIYGISSTVNGSELLNDVIKTDNNGNVTINLKGVGKSYTFTDEELNNVIKDDEHSFLTGSIYSNSGYYSVGDKDVLALELAIRNYRKEIDESGRAKANSYSYSFINYSGNDDMYTHSGQQSTAIGLLTGKNASVIRQGFDDNTIVKNGIIYKQKMDESTLKPILDNPENIVFVSLYNENAEGHAYTFKSYDEQFVYLVDPYDTSKVEKMSKSEFYNNILEVSYTDLKDDITPLQNEHRANLMKWTSIAADKETLNYLKDHFPSNSWRSAQK